MAEERTLGLARAPERIGEDESKEDLQRRLDQARNSISHTVSEIKESMAHQYQSVREQLDWREQYKKHPCAWSASALGVGVIAGYSIAGAFKDDRYRERAYETSYRYTPQRAAASVATPSSEVAPEDQGPGLVDRFKESAAYDALSREVSSLGNKVVEELSVTAHTVVLPFLINKLKELVGINQLEKSVPRSTSQSTTPRTDWSEADRTPRQESNLGHS